MIYQWLDLIWIPIALFIAKKDQRYWVLGFFLSCILMLRMQVEVMESTGYETGFTTIMSSEVFDRGLVVYSIMYILYLILLQYSPNARGTLLMAASISIFFIAFFVSSLVMIL